MSIGLASKDGSEVFISDSVIQVFKNIGMAAYTKKREYGPAGIIAEKLGFTGTNVADTAERLVKG